MESTATIEPEIEQTEEQAEPAQSAPIESTGTWEDKLSPAQRNKIKWAHRYVGAYRARHVGRAREHEQLVLVHDLAELLIQMQSSLDTMIEKLADVREYRAQE